MAKIIATFKAIVTRLIFAAHSFIAIWQVTQYKKDPLYWYLSAPILVLVLEGIFTLVIKKTQEWRWFCPSVFLYLSSIVPAIWLLELDKIERRSRIQDALQEETIDITKSIGSVGKDLKNLIKINLPDIQVNAETWVTLIEQFLMLILIVGRWMLPKGDLTRDQLSQLLLVYIGTAADIIEFFDSFKDEKVAKDQLLVFLTLGIWSWSLMQFTIVLSATRSRKPRGGGGTQEDGTDCCQTNCCCSLDVWGIALNILLQDAPFLSFRLLIIVHYNILTYMNVFFTCKNTLVILLQLYRLYAVYSDNSKAKKKLRRQKFLEARRGEIYVISNDKHGKKKKRDESTTINEKPTKKRKSRKDTGYSTASSSSSSSSDERPRKSRDKEKSSKSRRDTNDSDDQKKRRKDKVTKGSSSERRGRRSKSPSETAEKSRKRHKKSRKLSELTEESLSESSSKEVNHKKSKKKRSESSSSLSESD